MRPRASLSPLFLLVLFVVSLLACSGNSCAPDRSEPQPTPGSVRFPLQSVELNIKGQTLGAEVAATPESRTQGLMFRRSLAPDSGMLFVFEESEVRFFWMKNTFVPLSIAYLDTAGVITDILEMAPEDTTTRYFSSRPARYALEANAGWFIAHRIKPGDTVLGLPD